jgi:hypothetical protein
MVVATLVASVVLAALTMAAVGIRKSIAATHQYAVNVANETRLMDYVAQDLRRAVRVSMRNTTSGTSTVMKNYSNYTITDTSALSLRIPDYYGSNTRDNTAGSSYKTSRYPRATLNTGTTYNGNATAKLNGIVPWADAVTTFNGKRVTRFTPASVGDGEIEVRYYRGTRSTTDGTVSFFRAEYASGATTPIQVREIAERISDNTSTTSLTVTGKNDGLIFRLQSSFTPRYRFTGATTAGTETFVEVSCRNARRD